MYCLSLRLLSVHGHQNSSNKKKIPELKSMKTLSCTFFFHIVCKKKKNGCSKAVLVQSSDWLGEETQEMVCVLSRHRDSLWLRQEKPHLHPQEKMEKMHVCVLCLLKRL